MDTIPRFCSFKIILISHLRNHKKADFWNCICSPGRKRRIKCPSWGSRGSDPADQIPKTNQHVRASRNSESQPASMNNPLKRPLTYQNRPFVHPQARPLVSDWREVFLGKWMKGNQELLGHFHKKRGQTVSVVRMKLPTPGHGYLTGELGTVFRDVGWDSLDPWEAATVTCIKRHEVESCQFPVSRGTQYKALNFPGDWIIWREEWLAQFSHKTVANLSKLYKNSA